MLYTGKGGAGKTTIAAATAVRCAETNHRTLIVGSDTSQGLADCLNKPLSDEPLEVAPNLWAQELDPLLRLERSWPRIQPALGQSFRRDLSGTALEELTLAPGMGDVIRLLALNELSSSELYDVLVIDLGSSVAALQMLAYPEGAAWWVDRLTAGGGGDLGQVIDGMAQGLAELRAALGSADASVRIVMTSEQLALRETQRALTFMSLYGYNIDALVLNRQKSIPRSVAETFAAWPILPLTLYDRDVIGCQLLSAMAVALFPPPTDPTEVLVRGQAQRLTRQPSGYVLSLKLPFVHEDDIDLLQHQGQLILQIGRMRRVLQLPAPVDQLSAADAVLEDGALEIHFR